MTSRERFELGLFEARAEFPFLHIAQALERFDETTADCGETDLPRPWLDALTTLGYLSKPKRGWWELTLLGRSVINGRMPR